jgi:membrane protein implicated in regulation of membrane protease activity
MAGDFLTTWSWVFWLAIILIFIVVEVLSLSFVFLMLAVGSLGGLIAGLVGAPWWVQIIIAAALSLILLFFVRPPLLHVMKRGSDPARSNLDALIGLTGVVVATFDDHGRGQVKLANGETWTSRLSAGSTPATLAEGEKVIVTSIDGATAVVTPAPTS